MMHEALIGVVVYAAPRTWGRVVGFNDDYLVVQTRGGDGWRPDDAYEEVHVSRVEEEGE